MMMKKCLIVLFVALQICFAQIACSSNDEAFDYSDLWISKTSGTWESGKDYGYYRILVLRRPGKEHSQDDVYVQVVKRGENVNKIERTIKLDSPGYKGYVKDIELVNIEDINMVAVHMDIEMKAMNGIIMREIYLVSPSGKVKPLVQAKYMDIYDQGTSD